MFEETAFKNRYKEAYEPIVPDKDCVQRILEEAGRARHPVFTGTLRAAAAALAVCCLLFVVSLPAAAKTFPAVYKIVEKYTPSLADYVLPTKTGCTREGIVMQVEAVNVDGKDADILVSFSDEAGSGNDFITGEADMYDDYSLESYGSESNIGGCHFLEYDETEDKAYFKLDVSAADEFDNTKLTFRTYRLLTNCTEEKRWISLQEVVRNPATKGVTLSGGSVSKLFADFDTAEDDGYRPAAQVLDLQKADETLAEALTVTGIGYADGILRIQTCRGSFADADRHMEPFLVDEEGNERHCDASVGWQEEVNGERLLFDEHWFLVEESELENIRLYGIFYIRDGCVQGNWEVTFQLE